MAYDNDPSDSYGNFVAVTEDGMLAVGAPYNDQMATYAGAVYLYDSARGGVGNWGLRRKITTGDANQYDYFGYGLAAWGDDFVAIGCAQRSGTFGTGAGVAYLQHLQHLQETPTVRLTADDAAEYDQFGNAAALTSDGSRAAIAVVYDDTLDPEAGSVRIFDKDAAGTWSQSATLLPQYDEFYNSLYYSGFGQATAFDSTGKFVFVGAPFENTAGLDRGRTYIFRGGDSAGDPWTVSDLLTPPDGGTSDQFGTAISVSGTTAVISAEGYGDYSGAMHVYEYDGATSWTFAGSLWSPDPEMMDSYGGAVSISGSVLVAGAPGDDEAGFDEGAAYVYEQSGSTWTLVGKLPNPSPTWSGNSRFGRQVAVSDSAGLLAVSAPGYRVFNRPVGAVFLYERSQDGTTWSLTASLEPREQDAWEANFNFGGALVMAPDGSRLLVGMSNDRESGYDSGAAFVFDRDANGNFVQRLKMTAPGHYAGVADGAGAAYLFNADLGYEMPVRTGDDELFFPGSGDGGVTITLTSATPGGTVSVTKYGPVAAPPSMFRNPQALVNEFLRIIGDDLGSFTATIEWELDPANVARLGALAVNEVYRFRGGQHLGTFSVTLEGNVLTITGVSGFSDWYAGSSTAVPVTVSGFTVD